MDRIRCGGRLVHAHAERFGQAENLSRMRILPKPDVRRALRLWGMHRITQHSDSRDRYLHDVVRDERADSGRSTRGDHISWIKRHHPGYPSDEKFARIGHERSAAGLAQRAIDVGFDEHVRGIKIGLDMWPDGTKRVEAFGPRELHIGLLQVARGNVIHAGIPEDIFESVVGVGQMRTAAPDHNSKLRFMFDALRVDGQHNRFARTDDRRRRLEEDHRVFREFVAEFGGVCRLVPADTDNFPRHDWRGKAHIRELPGVGRARPFSPGRAREFADLPVLQQTVEWSSRPRDGSVQRQKPAKFHR